MERRRFRTEGGLTMTECNWCKDEICVNADCPICCDYCPVPDTEGVCKFEDRGKRHFTVHDRNSDHGEEVVNVAVMIQRVMAE